MQRDQERLVRFTLTGIEPKVTLTHGYDIINDFPVHIHRTFCLNINESGLCILHIRGADYKVSPNNVVIIPPFEPHSIDYAGARTRTYKVVSFQSHELGNWYFPKLIVHDKAMFEHLGWKQANGALRDVVCRGLLLMLERAGQIELPPVRWQIQGQCRTQRRRPEALLLDTAPLSMKLQELGSIEITQVRRTADEPLFNSLLEHHHYLGYEQPVGEHWNMWSGRRGGRWRLGWSSAPRHMGSRDRYIG